MTRASLSLPGSTPQVGYRALGRALVYPDMTESMPMPRYQVMVDDNFHYQDSDERREQGTYETVEEARSRRAVELSINRWGKSIGPVSRPKLSTAATRASAMIPSSWCS